MSLKIMQGFDSIGNDQDFRTQGWLYPAGGNTQLALSVPSSTGVLGKAIKYLSGTINGTAVNSDAATAMGSSGEGSIGILNSGITVDQAWSAGGFAMGGSAKFYQTPNLLNPYRHQIGYDSQNNLYYVIMGSTAAIYTSPDLSNWTPCAAQPPGVVAGWCNTFSYMGNGVMMFCPVVASTSMTVYWTNNNGRTWNAQTLGTLTSASNYICKGIATGNSTYPMMINIGGQNSAYATNGIYVGTLGGTFVLAKATAVAYQATTGVIGVPGITSSGLIYTVSNSQVISCQNVTTADISQAANWTITSGFDGSCYDMQYYPKGNVWVCASGANGFIYTLANPGTAGAPLAPTSTTRTGITLANSAGATYSMQVFVTNSGNNCVVIGGAGSNGASMYAYSTDGSTWQTKFTVQPNNNVAYTGFTVAGNQCSFYSGCIGQNGRIVKVGNAASSASCTFIASSPDGVNNWVTNYATDQSSPGTTGLYKGFGFRSATAAPTNGGTWTVPVGTGAGAYFNAGANTGTSVPVTLYNATGTAVATVNVNTSGMTTPQQLTHYYEIVAVPTATAYTFNFNYYIDGALVGTSAGQALGTATGQPILILFPRCSYMTNFDDLYFTLQDGTNTVAPLSAWNIQAPALTGDAQAQWTKSGTAASNAASVNVSLATAGSYVSTSVDGAKDEYNTAGVTANSKVLAVQNETNFQAQSGTPSCSIGILSGATELDGTAITANTLGYTRTTVLSEKDPNGNVAWTVASANAAKVVVNKIS